MQSVQQLRRPVSLTIISIVYLVMLTLTVLLYINLYSSSPYGHAFSLRWSVIMIGLNLPILIGVICMYRLRRIGIWLFLVGKVLFFAVPTMAGTMDSVMGLATPLFFLESGVLFILFANHTKYMR